MKPVRVSVFGAPRVSRQGEDLRFDTRKAVALLAYLAVTGRAHRRETLAALLWPRSDQARARSALRRTLSVAGAVGPGLVTSRDIVELDRSLVWCDAQEFEELVGRGDRTSRAAAVRLASGEFMAGFSLRDSAVFDDWQVSTAVRLGDQLVSALSALVDEAITAGRLDEATALVRRWLAVDPLAETAHAQLMRLLAWSGQRTAALQHFRTLVRLLDRELGVAPLPDTSDLYDAIHANRFGSVERQAPRAVEPSPAGSRSAPERAEPDIVGRDAERRRLLSLWSGSAGRGAVVGIASEAGVGRTRLVLDLAAEVAGRGGRSLVVRAHEGERDLAAATARDLVRALAAQVPPDAPGRQHLLEAVAPLDPSLTDLTAGPVPLDSPGAQVRLFEAVRLLLAGTLGGDPPGALVVDDAHWLDPTSADLLAYVTRRAPPGLLVVVTWRPGNDSAQMLGRLFDDGEVLVLGPLSAADVAELVHASEAPGIDPVEVHQRTGGNPRLVVEHLTAAREGSGTSRHLRDLVQTRWESVSPTSRQLLSAAAVVGVVADPELLRSTAGRDEVETVEALEAVVERGLLVEDPGRGGYDFPYELLREVVVERTSLARQRLLHSRAADVLARRHGVDPSTWPAAVVARHLSAAGRTAEAASWFWTAAMESGALYAHREELEQLQAARAAGLEPVRVHEALGDALTRLGRYRDALASYQQAAAAISDDDEGLACVEHKLANVHDRLGEWTIAQAYLDSADALLEREDPPALRARVGADLALVLHRQGLSAAAEERAQRAVADGVASRDVLALAQVHDVLGVLAIGAGDLDAAVAHLEESVVWAGQLDDVGPAVAAENNLARALDLMGRSDDALEAARRALAHGEQHGDQHRVGALHANLADLLHRRGEEEEAQREARASAVALAAVDDAGLRPQVWTLVEW